ncbi:zinc ABC transporter substrate-binding protein [Bacillus sp. AFS001701]|uniref:metal ABC transporter substrate-binding protein n=1 Tax=Bacillaceae TaxID=186817 RepID=UPI000BF68D7E|nr:metal ABC transporter substrate-binding protein [Bacillus sp. AFS001701]PET55388.1 zinc ABC transporter substrate-binding protein [Bacillus sp. AFS001701]
MKKINLRSLLSISISIFLLAGCSSKSISTSNNSENESKKIKIVTTFYPVYEFTKNVAKENADIKLLIPSSIEPHEWEPTPKDVGAIQNADLFIYNSPYMETWVPNIEKSLDNKKSSFIEASSGISLIKGQENEEEHSTNNNSEQMDPHVWLSPVLAQKEVQNITKALINIDPAHKAEYKKNSDNYIKRLQALDEQYRTTLMNMKNKEVITQHAAFGYLTKQYGLVQVPIAGLSPSNEPSPSRLADLKQFAKSHDINTIFFEEVASPKVANTLANEIGAKTAVLNTLEGLSEDEQKQGIDYISVMENNLKILKKVLENK